VSLVKQYRVPAKHTDWEDIATDDAGRVYVANTGNNDAKRDAVEVFRLAEPNRRAAPRRGDRARDPPNRSPAPTCPRTARRLALVSSGQGARLYLFDVNGDVAAAGRAVPTRVPLPPRKIEAVAFTTTGILMTSETREVYRYAE
jgi:hypothetical protein